MEIVEYIFIVLFGALVVNAGLIMRWRWTHGKFPSIKQLLVCNAILAGILIIYELLPKSDGRCRLTVAIDSRNSRAEVVVDERFSYNLLDDREVVLNDLTPNGFLAVRTGKTALIAVYSHPTHVFSFGHKMKINIRDDAVKVSVSPWLSFATITDDPEVYDKVIHIYRNAR